MTSGDAARLAGAVAALALLAAAAGWMRGTGQVRDVGVVTVRAAAQLLLVGAVLGIVFATPALAAVYLAVMLAAACVTSARRLRPLPRVWPATLAAITAGAGVAAGPVFLSGTLTWTTRDVVPFVAQLVGGAMTATTLAALRLVDEVAASWNLVEGWLALGATPARAAAGLARTAASRALVPALDQTRNVGLVVLPGAYVGLLLAGASPLEAGRVQLLVLVGLLAAETVAAAVVTAALAGRLGAQRPPQSGAHPGTSALRGRRRSAHR